MVATKVQLACGSPSEGVAQAPSASLSQQRDRPQFASRMARLGPCGLRAARVLRFAMKDGKIARIELLANRARLDALHLAVLPD